MRDISSIVFMFFLFIVCAAAIIFSIIFGYNVFFVKAIPVETMRIKIGNLDEIVKMSGNVDAEQSDKIISKVSGTIENLKVKEGERVKMGEKLCTIRNTQLHTKLLETKAELMTAKQSTSKIKGEREQFLKEIITDIEQTIQPIAHINGNMINIDVKNGSEVIPGMELFFIADMSNPTIKARLYESDVQKVKNGQPVLIAGDFLGGESLLGKVIKIDEYVKKEIENYVEVTCKIFNPQKPTIKYGADADVKVITKRGKNVLLIPKEALIIDNGEFAFVVKRNIAYLTPIKIGIVGEKYAEVVSGLKEGDRIITKGSLDVKDGDNVAYK